MNSFKLHRDKTSGLHFFSDSRNSSGYYDHKMNVHQRFNDVFTDKTHDMQKKSTV